MKLNKVGREVIDRFEELGIDVEVRAGRKHYLVYFHDELVFKFGQGTKRPEWAMRSLDATARWLLENRAK